MKPLLVKDLETFTKRFNSFKNGAFKNFNIISPTHFEIELLAQDEARMHDWVTVSFELTGASSANLLDNSKLSLINMDNGVSITHNGIDFAFNLLNSTFFIECTTIKYQEGAF